MRNLVTICVALVVMLGIVSGNLWHELRSARQQIIDLEGDLAQAKIPVVQPAPVQPPPPITVEAPPAPPPPPAVPQPPTPLPTPPMPDNCAVRIGYRR